MVFETESYENVLTVVDQKTKHKIIALNPRFFGNNIVDIYWYVNVDFTHKEIEDTQIFTRLRMPFSNLLSLIIPCICIHGFSSMIFKI